MTLTCHAVMISFLMIIISGHATQKILEPHEYGRFVRAVNLPQANTSTISRHMTLARVFSAIYLEIQVTNKTMNRKEILANVWNLENSQDLDKFVSLKFKGVSEQLNAFSSSISKTPHVNETEMIEFKADYERFQGFNGQKRQDIIIAEEFREFPQVPLDLFPKPELTYLILNRINLTREYFPNGVQEHLDRLKEYIQTYYDVLFNKYKIKFEETVKSVLAVETKLSAAMAFLDLQDSVTRIQNMLPNLEMIVNHQKSLSAVSITTNTIHLLEELYSVFSMFDKPLTSVPIGHALHRRLNLTQIEQDIRNKWVDGMLNNTKMFQNLSDFYTNGKSALNPIELITMNSDILFDRNNYNMIRYFVKKIKIIQRSKSINNIENVANRDCLTLLHKNVSRQDIEKLLQFPPYYKKIEEAFYKYENARRSIPNIQLVVQELEELKGQFPSSTAFTDQNWEWLTRLSIFVAIHSDDYNRMQAGDNVRFEMRSLNDQPEINDLLHYVLRMIPDLTIGEQRCDSMFTLDLAEIDNTTNIAKIINNIKSEGATKKVIDFVAAVEKMQKSLNELGEESEVRTKNSSKRNIDDVVLKEYNDYPSLLLNYSYAAYSLEQLNKLYDQLSLLIQKGDDVVAVIRKMNDSEDKTELNNSWKDFTTLKKKLIEFQTNSTKILEIVNSSKFSQPERTLHEVGLVYKEISTILIAGSFDLRKMRESMILLNPRIPDVESALVHLETPLAMNWNLVQRSFESVPDVLFAIQKIQQVTPTEPQTMIKYIIIGVVTLGIIVVAIIVVLVCSWMNRKDSDLKLDPPPENAYVAPSDKFIYSRDPCRNAAGEDCDTWADSNGVDHIFKEYYELNRNPSTKPRRIIPKNTPRTWNVLVLDDCKFKGYKRRKLPLRIKKRITWGYVKGKDLDEFTHVVLPSKYVYDKNALKLDDTDLMTYKLYACKAVLMNRDWLEALVKIKDKAMDEDYNWYVLNTRYNGETHRDTIYNMKTNHYRMVPCLLKNADICILQSTSKNFEKNRNEWKKIIEMLGGTYVNMTDIKPDGPKTNTPYWTRTEAYKGEMHEFSQNRCWILKTKGCRINGEWRKDHGMYTFADFKFLTESIARNSILKKENDVVPLDYEGNSVSQESKGTSSTVISSTTKSSSKSPHTISKTPVKSRMAAMKDTKMEKRQQDIRKEIKKASSKATVNQ